MKKVKEVAEMLDVSYQTVYNHMNKNKDAMVGTVFKKLGVTHINDEGIKILKESMGLIQVPTVQKDDVSMEEIIEKISDRVGLIMKEELKDMKNNTKKESESMKNEIEQLKKQNKELISMIQERQEQEKNKSLWDRLFNK